VAAVEIATPAAAPVGKKGKPNWQKAAEAAAAEKKSVRSTDAPAAKATGGKVFAGELVAAVRCLISTVRIPPTGLTFCLTGTLSIPKAKVESLIKSNGGKIAGSITGAVTHAVAAAMGTGKADKAQEKGAMCCSCLCRSNYCTDDAVVCRHPCVQGVVPSGFHRCRQTCH
jgi:NAD-dependent DNA ligase